MENDRKPIMACNICGTYFHHNNEMKCPACGSHAVTTTPLLSMYGEGGLIKDSVG